MRPANKKGRIGTIMVTPSKIPANDSPPPLMRAIVMSSGLLAFGLVRCIVASDGNALRHRAD